MLAASMDSKKGETMESLRFPLLASPKIDGIRCLIMEARAMSRSLKPIPNQHVARLLGKPQLAGLDGELLVGDGTSFQKVTSGIMSRSGEPEFSYHVFDTFAEPGLPYRCRVERYRTQVHGLRRIMPWVKAVPVIEVASLADLLAFTEDCLVLGYEGAMVRLPDGPYKFGRATFAEGYLTKIKPFEDDEAVVIGFEEQEENRNEATTDELGRTKRSSHQANKVAKGTLGALILSHPKFGTFRCGTGFDDALRKEVWEAQSLFMGRLAKFRYQAAGMKDKPRIPSFKGFRHPDDLS